MAKQGEDAIADHIFDFEDGVRIIITRNTDKRVKGPMIHASMSFFDDIERWAAEHCTAYHAPDRFKCVQTIRTRVLLLLKHTPYALGRELDFMLSPEKGVPNVMFRLIHKTAPAKASRN